MCLQAIFENILSRNISWPEELSPECQDLIEGLLCLDPQQRLGHRGTACPVLSRSCTSYSCQPAALFSVGCLD